MKVSLWLFFKLFNYNPKFNSRWSQAFKKHLTDHVVKSLSDLNNFIEKADEGLMQQVKEDDYDGLVKGQIISD